MVERYVWDRIEKRLEELDDDIEGLESDIAPKDFLKDEIRRIIVIRGLHELYNEDKNINWIDKRHLNYLQESLEDEYLCYFETERFQKITKYNKSSWKAIYAGCNSQIESFLIENGFEEFIKSIASEDKEIKPDEKRERAFAPFISRL